jgi:hypothetical protein
MPWTVRYRRERWLLPSGETVLAALPKGLAGHFGANLKRFVLSQYHQGQVTIPRLAAQLTDLGIEISKRQIVRLLTGKQDAFVKENIDVLRAGLASASWLRKIIETAQAFSSKMHSRFHRRCTPIFMKVHIQGAVLRAHAKVDTGVRPFLKRLTFSSAFAGGR